MSMYKKVDTSLNFVEREKEVVEAKTFHTGEIHLEEDYLDDDVDDYVEKS